MFSRNILHYDNEVEIQGVIGEGGTFYSISVSTGYQHAVKIQYLCETLCIIKPITRCSCF